MFLLQAVHFLCCIMVQFFKRFASNGLMCRRKTFVLDLSAFGFWHLFYGSITSLYGKNLMPNDVIICSEVLRGLAEVYVHERNCLL